MHELSRLVKLILPLRGWLALAVLLSFGALGASVGLMAMSAYLISKAALVTGFADLAVIVTAVRAFAIARAAMRYGERYVTHLATFHILTRLRVWFYAAIEPLAPARLQSYHSGDLFTRLSADMETLEQFYARVVVPPLAAALVTALACAILGALDVQLGLVLLLFLLVTGIALPLVTRQLSVVPSRQFIATRAQFNTTLTDTIHGIGDVLAFGQETFFQQRAQELNHELNRAQLRLAILRGFSGALAVMLAGLAGVTILFLAIPLVTAGKIEGVYLALLPLTAITAFEAVQPLSAALQQLEASQASAKRLFELVDAAPIVSEPAQPLAPSADFSIEFENVSFAYAPAELRALDNVSFRIPSGGRVIVTGASGAGKSSLVNLLERFWEIQQGRICIGGRDLRAYRADDVRAMSGVVSQNTFLFHGTIRDNLLVAKGDATDAEMIAACRAAQLHDFIAALPLDYDTLVGENGLKLSGGERQRLAIARVILKNAPILILDEATAHLDALTQERVMRALETFMQGKTTLLISHRRVNLNGQHIHLERGRIENSTRDN